MVKIIYKSDDMMSLKYYAFPITPNAVEVVDFDKVLVSMQVDIQKKQMFIERHIYIEGKTIVSVCCVF